MTSCACIPIDYFSKHVAVFRVRNLQGRVTAAICGLTLRLGNLPPALLLGASTGHFVLLVVLVCQRPRVCSDT